MSMPLAWIVGIARTYASLLGDAHEPREHVVATLDRRPGDELALRVRDLGITGTEVERGDPERGEPRHVGPAQLRAHGEREATHELVDQRVGEVRRRRELRLEDLDV